ncbi:peptidylprolyl isomerase [Paracoccus benzoatiresistens]|uniref:Parvulin-like PPIase n=1 Tax=Paracoccus benzoatiresistens TaxID=2997341 RepID=A0ABT4J5J5_9RHOB|nr:peptidylprolyl isomerase [Paracoccus sp. EF6]MCZ0962357.1 peptidylprolyl isomerase [Paracoccus sp. EF6]
MLHFLLIGALVFAAHAVFAPAPPPPAERIEITREIIAQLEAQFAATWTRPPTEAERKGLLDEYLRQEVFYREALLLGLDRDDVVIRQRLQQKMEFMTVVGAETAEVTEDQLHAHYKEIKEGLAMPPLMTFSQVFLGDTHPEQAVAALEKLRSGTDPEALAHGSILPLHMRGAVPAEVDGTFGPGFFDAIRALESGHWSGPVTSAYGLHLVRLEALSPATTPPFEEVRRLVEEDWRRREGERQREAHYQSLRARYDIILPEGAATP